MTTTPTIQPHNQKAQATWDAPGKLYEEISRGISDSIDHCVLRLAPKPGERILDLACGTGWASRAVAQAAPGAQVVGVDLGPEMVAFAGNRAGELGLSIEYRVGDAEKLPFEDASFDKVISTCGVMFASRQDAAAGELARVCKKGGRIGLTTWKPDSTLFEMFQVMKPYMPPPPDPPPPSPFAWGNRDRVRELLGGSFDVAFEEGVSTYRTTSGEAAWDHWSTHYGPMRTLAGNLPPDRRESLRKDIIAFFERFRADLGIAKPRAYLLTIGTRR